jgi:hypothetical protein
VLALGLASSLLPDQGRRYAWQAAAGASSLTESGVKPPHSKVAAATAGQRAFAARGGEAGTAHVVPRFATDDTNGEDTGTFRS